MTTKKHYPETMEQQLQKFLEGYRVKSKEPFTHTTKDPKGSYYISSDEEDRFLTYYCNLIKKGARPTLTEKPGAYGPLRIDFDMKASLDEGLRRQYTREMVIEIIKICQTIIKDSIPDYEFEDKMTYCLLLEKSGPRVEDGCVKDGFHLHFPHFICEGWVQDEYVRSVLTERMIAQKIWSGCKYSKNIEDIVDTNMAVKTWLMYGSAKFNQAEPYLFSEAFDENTNNIELDIVFDLEMHGRKCSVNYYLPRFLSIKGYSECTLLKPEIQNRKKAKPKRRVVTINRKRNIEEVLADIKTITDGGIMDMISTDRADDYQSWMDVGWILYNIGEGCDEALELWIDFSQKSSKFIPGACEDAWSRMELKGKTIASLFAIAKTDSPNEYRAWKSQQINYQLYRSLVEEKPNEWDVSEVIKHVYNGRFICADAKTNVWYEFKNHRWQLMDDALSLKKLFCNEIRELYYALKEDIVRKQRAAQDDESERLKLEKMEKKCCRMTTVLKEVSFHEKLMKMCKIQFHDPLFLKLIDENKQLFGCENGVLDLKARLFREGRPDDYITISCGHNYNKHYKFDDDDIQDVHDYLSKIFVNPNLKNYFLDSSCACLEGGNTNKIFIVHTGPPDGGKSMTMGFLEKTFGDYCVKFPRELFIVSGKTTSGGARPELSRVRGKRIGLGQEVAKTETFNIGVIKELTGNDSFFARGLFEKGCDIKPMFTLMMQCNEPPHVPGHDDATWTRTRLLPYESKFVKPREIDNFPVPETEEERIKMKRWKADPTIEARLEELYPAFLWILFNRYDEYKQRGGIRDPPEVVLATASYRQLNDVFLQFIKERIEKVEIEKDSNPVPGVSEEIPFLKLVDLATEFTDWFRENNASYAKEKFTRIQLGHEFSKRFGPLIKKGNSSGWMGYKIIIEEAEDEKEKAQQALFEKSQKKGV